MRFCFIRLPLEVPLAVIFSNFLAYDMPLLYSFEADHQLFVEVGELLHFILASDAVLAVFADGSVLPAKLW